MAEHQLPKLTVRVRFPSSALKNYSGQTPFSRTIRLNGDQLRLGRALHGLIANLAQHIRHHAGHDGIQPVWAPPGTHLDVGLIGEVAVWRAANGIAPHDRRPSGPAQLQTLPALWQ